MMIMSTKEEKKGKMEEQIVKNARIFLSKIMTIEELENITGIKKEKLLKDFKETLPYIDEDLALSVRMMINFTTSKWLYT